MRGPGNNEQKPHTTVAITVNQAASSQLKETPLHTAARKGDIASLERLFCDKIDPNQHQSRAPATPIHVAAAHHQSAAVQFLASKGADPRSALQYIEHHKQSPLIKPDILKTLRDFTLAQFIIEKNSRAITHQIKNGAEITAPVKELLTGAYKNYKPEALKENLTFFTEMQKGDMNCQKQLGEVIGIFKGLQQEQMSRETYIVPDTNPSQKPASEPEPSKREKLENTSKFKRHENLREMIQERRNNGEGEIKR